VGLEKALLIKQITIKEKTNKTYLIERRTVEVELVWLLSRLKSRVSAKQFDE